MGIVSRFPKSWKITVEVHRSGGSDDNGDPKPVQVISLKECLIGPRSSTEKDSASDAATSELSLFRDPDPSFRFKSTDRIVVPAGAFNAGSYLVSGRPREFPIGVEVPLEGVGPDV
ncbi:hypothetical protein ACTXL8_05550 [Glutamicibacter arilaitensis]|uniref:hypothetical protein n=1 Tax=Glutamicibacter arilaitensis TaxID=256701 RepID=UPI003FD5F0D2